MEGDHMSGWKKWPVLEGLTKTTSAIIQKMVGVSSAHGIGAPALSYFLVGLTQFTGGLCGIAFTGRKFFPGWKAVMPALIFGFFAATMTVIGLVTFQMNADLGVRILIVVSSVVPGSILGRVLFGDPFGRRQWIGTAFFLVAAWAMLGFPQNFSLAPWVWLTALIALMAAINEVITRVSASKLDVWTNSMYVGLSTMLWCGIAVVWWGVQFASLTHAFVLGSFLLGGVTLGMVIFKLLAYAVGGKDATINLKKLIMQGTYLITGVIAGTWIYHEPLTTGKIIGVLLFFVAFSITDKDAWKFFSPAPKLK